MNRFQTMIRNPEYNEFLDYMCPGARPLGMTPPPGTDPLLCPRAIIGTWDDHDFGWNNGDSRLEQKWVREHYMCHLSGSVTPLGMGGEAGI